MLTVSSGVKKKERKKERDKGERSYQQKATPVSIIQVFAVGGSNRQSEEKWGTVERGSEVKRMVV